jgi:hypothetical protein
MVVDTSNVHMGIQYLKPDRRNNTYNCPPPFMMPPRVNVLEITGLKDDATAKSIFEAAQAIEHCKKGTTKRHCNIFGDNNDCHKYVGAFGKMPNRKTPGIGDTVVTTDLPPQHHECLKLLFKKMEEVFKAYADPGAVGVAKSVSELIDDHPTLAECEYFTGLATGTNKYLQVHVDKDVTMSMVLILKHQACEVEDDVVVYFGFPRLNVAVPLRPGDILLFNALEPHALSSRCNIEDELVCMSLYYKTAVAGLNDNSMPLTKTEQGLAKKYQDEYT